MKKLIPVIIAIVLIGLVVVLNFGKIIYDKYSYGDERADLNEYFQIFGEDDVPIILGNARAAESAHYIDGTLYFDIETVENHFTERFYLDTNENLLLFSKPTLTIETEVGTDTYTDGTNVFTEKYPLSVIKKDTLYIAVDYLKKFVNFSYEVFADPNHMQVDTSWETKTMATLKSDTTVRWRGGVKSPILRDISNGEAVEILEVMDDWTKVKTDDSYIGYVENHRLSDTYEETPVPVKDVPVEETDFLLRDFIINLTWHNIEYPQDGYDLKDALKNTKSVNVVSPTWYWLSDNEGNFDSVANVKYSQGAHDIGVEVWALISNFHSGADVDTHEVLSYTSKRRALVANLVADAVAKEADGINVDFENVESRTASHYVQFIRELGIECHKNGLVLSVDNYVPTEYTAHYNRKAQSEFADYIIIMGYDEHYKGSDVGSVSSIPWMTTGIEKTIQYVPAERVINAVPFYTRVWMTEDANVTSEAVTMEVAQNFISKNNMDTPVDDATNQHYGEKTMGGVLYQVWLEDNYSLNVRLNVMKKNNLAGIASWKLGQELPEVWDSISAYVNP